MAKRPAPGGISTWTCEGCGTECSRPRVQGPVPKWCPDCRVSHGHIKGSDLLPRDCVQCSVTFTPDRSTQVYCSGTCRHTEPAIWTMGWCPRCGAAFTARSIGSPRYCSQRCGRADHDERRAAIKRNAFVENVYRYRIYERDKWTCQLCGKRVKRKAVVPDPKAPTLDHIVPLSMGGTHEPANVQCAHFRCNATKSAGFYLRRSEQLRLLG